MQKSLSKKQFHDIGKEVAIMMAASMCIDKDGFDEEKMDAIMHIIVLYLKAMEIRLYGGTMEKPDDEDEDSRVEREVN